jgi:GNAT superfamily N-acetyltransferase
MGIVPPANGVRNAHEQTLRHGLIKADGSRVGACYLCMMRASAGRRRSRGESMVDGTERRLSDGVNVRPLRQSDAPNCDAVVRSLPYHFGHEGGRAECARAVRTSDGLVAEVEGRVVGFLTVSRHYETAAEVTWMAVQAEERGRGIGRALIQRLVEQIRAEGRQLLLVTTLSDSVHEGDAVDGYARTRAFYRAMGFLPARELPLWDEPALLMVMPIAPES